MHVNIEVEDVKDTNHMSHQTPEGMINMDWQFLNNQSTVDQFVNLKYLKSTHPTEKPIDVFCNSGSILEKKKGMLGLVEM